MLHDANSLQSHKTQEQLYFPTGKSNLNKGCTRVWLSLSKNTLFPHDLFQLVQQAECRFARYTWGCIQSNKHSTLSSFRFKPQTSSCHSTQEGEGSTANSPHIVLASPLSTQPVKSHNTGTWRGSRQIVNEHSSRFNTPLSVIIWGV